MKKTAKAAPLPPQRATSITPYLHWIVGAIASLLYINTLGHGFALDDVAVITQNKYVHQGLGGIPRLLTTFYWQGYWNLNAGLYRPLSLISFAIEYQLGHGAPFIHHLMQVLLYGFTVAMLYQLLNRLLGTYATWLPLAATLLFAAHPAHTEVVANIKSRDEILCFLFFVLAALQLHKYGKATWQAILYFALCLLSKEAGILFLPVFFLIYALLGNRPITDSIKTLLPLVLVAGVWLAWHSYVIYVASPPRVGYTYEDNALLSCPDTLSRIQTGIVMLGMYIAKSVWPWQLSYDYSFSEIPCESGFSVKAFSVLIICVALIYVGIRQYRKQPVLSFAIIYFFCTILLASNVFFLIGSTMGDRLLFAPTLGSAIALAWLLFRFTGSIAATKMANTATVAACAIALLYSWKTVARNPVWQNDYTLFTTDTANAPGSARIWYNAGTAMLNSLPDDKNERAAVLTETIGALQKSVAIDSDKAAQYTNLGTAYYKAGDYTAAIAATTHAMKLTPQDTSLQLNLADALFMMKRYDEAIARYEFCIAHIQIPVAAYDFLGTALFNTKSYDHAIAVLQKGLSIDSTSAEMWTNYGNALGVSGKYPEAIHAFGKALQIEPARKAAIYAMALTYQNMGDTVNARTWMARMQ